MPVRRSRITVVEIDYSPDESVPPLTPPTRTRKIPYSGPASDWSGEKTTFVEEVEYLPSRILPKKKTYAEQFSDKVSLVDHKDYGIGPIRHRDSSGKYFHGVNNHSTTAEKTHNHFGGKYDASHFKHCHFSSEKYETKPCHPQWDHFNHQGFCNNCEPVDYLNKGRRTLTIYRCLGH